ncbi:MAG: phosphotransferase [Saprospiraceae bacterium]
MKKYPIVPRRGLNTKEAVQQRRSFLDTENIDTTYLSDSQLDIETIKHNIESYIGSVEIPVGLIGPLLFNYNKKQEYVYAPAATLEGALVASINRGAKAISNSGGFNAIVIHQKMIRSPMFVFNNLNECLIFKNWVDNHFEEIKNIAEQYSNHAKLEKIDAIIASRSVNLKFVYTTGDASGQNMTTTCTWNAVLWVNKHFQEETNIEPVHYVIEGNSASDKKVSNYSVSQGRGVHVIAECELLEKEIQRVLHVNSDDFLTCLYQSYTMSRLDGMVGYNINVSNAIAAIFAATGQDLASIHESSVGILNMERTKRGLYCTLHLPALVIGTIGGGTHLPKQREALTMMDCQGKGKIERFAKMIAGFALSLEISTFAAIVGGQFAKAHEKMGRNKPVNWLLKAEINQELLQRTLIENEERTLETVEYFKKSMVQNGIIIGLTSRINNKITGFIPMKAIFKNNKTEQTEANVILLKSKPLDSEVMQGLHFMAASIEPRLADLLEISTPNLEYKNCHLKEVAMYRALHESGLDCTPTFYGSLVDGKREIFLITQEMLNPEELLLFNTENEPELWEITHIKSVIESINKVHQYFKNDNYDISLVEIPAFEPWKSTELYCEFAKIIELEYQDTEWSHLSKQLHGIIDELEELHNDLKLEKTIIHNDCNTRNLAIRQNGKVCFYDWELAVIDFPHRDIVEFLSFVLPKDFEENILIDYLKYHHSLQEASISWEDWLKGYAYAIRSYLVTRVSFYMTGKIMVDYSFAGRVFLNTFKMLETVERLENQ